MRLWARNELTLDDTHHDSTSDAKVIDASLAAFGLVLENDVDVALQSEAYLWPDNVTTWWLWFRIQTQWHFAMEQRVGLNYAGVQACLALHGVKQKERAEIFSALQAMENAALAAWAEQKN